MLVFLKLGGSLITDKSKSRTPQIEVIRRIGDEISDALREVPDLQLILGHGSGSFGHVPANKYRTIEGVFTEDSWKGFCDVWHEARALNNIMIEKFNEAMLDIISFPPSAMLTCTNRKITQWNLNPIISALKNKQIPLIYGDTVYDDQLGGTILSTEELFFYLAVKLHPHRICIAGIESGVYQNYPIKDHIIPVITRNNYSKLSANITGSHEVDVTGGMLHKIKMMLELAEILPGVEISIFSGSLPGNINNTLLGRIYGTEIKS